MPVKTARPVLVVEDDDDCRLMIASLLATSGYPVITAPNGAEALVLARRHPPCLVLLDLMMPVMDGEAFRDQQLADAALRDVSVLLLTAHPDGPAIARRMGAVGCVGKPPDLEELMRRVDAHCATLTRGPLSPPESNS